MRRRPNGGWIEVITGGMFSGKTEELIRLVRRSRYAQQQVQVFKPALDTRYNAKDDVASHDGNIYTATPVKDSDEIRKVLDRKTTVVAIDEAQFFDAGIVDLCEELADSGLRVIVAGLNLDFRGEPFGPMPQILVRADEIVTLNAICVECGSLASRTQRLIDGEPAAYDDPVILVGGQEEGYEARCRACHEVPTPGV